LTGTKSDIEGLSSSRAKILESAEALFAQFGFAGVGLREVAQRVGLGKSSLFHHFPTKVHLYVAVLERIFQRLDARLSGALAQGGSAAELLDRWVGALIDALAENPTHAPLLLRCLFEAEVVGPEQRARLEAARAGILAEIETLLREGIEAGELRPVAVPHAIQTLIGMTVYHFASGEFGDQLLQRPVYSEAEVRRRKEEVRAFLRRGLAPERS
jgi:AcrR family transcriptional regulator